MSTQFLSGIVVALVAAVIAPIVVDFYTRGQKRRAIRGAFCGEIGALIEIVERRNYIKDLEQFIRHLKATKAIDVFTFSASNDYFPVFRSQVENIGLLSPVETKDIVGFYVMVQAMLEDLKDVNSGRRTFHTHEDCVSYHEEFYGLLCAVVDRGRRLVNGTAAPNTR